MRNTLIPPVKVIGLTFASLLAGAVLTETIFSWPGVGQFAVRMALKLDYPGLLGVTLVVAVGYILVNLAVDILYGVLDPRIRVSLGRRGRLWPSPRQLLTRSKRNRWRC